MRCKQDSLYTDTRVGYFNGRCISNRISIGYIFDCTSANKASCFANGRCFICQIPVLTVSVFPRGLSDGEDEQGKRGEREGGRDAVRDEKQKRNEK